MKSGKALLAIFAGMAAGAAVGALFASDKKSELKNKKCNCKDGCHCRDNSDPSGNHLENRIVEAIKSVLHKVSSTKEPVS